MSPQLLAARLNIFTLRDTADRHSTGKGLWKTGPGALKWKEDQDVGSDAVIPFERIERKQGGAGGRGRFLHGYVRFPQSPILGARLRATCLDSDYASR